MSPAGARDRLEAAATQWRTRVHAADAAIGLAGGVLVAGLLVHLVARPAAMGIGLVVAIALFAVGLRRSRAARVDARALARHLDRTEPRLEESAELLLATEAELAPLERLQRARVDRVFADVRPAATLPVRRLQRVSLVAAAVGVVGLVALMWPVRKRPAVAASRPAAERPARPSRIVRVEAAVVPPAYTGRAARRSADLDLEAEAGSRITWTVTLDRPADVRLATTDHDTLTLTGGGTERQVTIDASHPVLYSLDVVGGATGALHRLSVVPDQPPVLTIVRPVERTTIEMGQPLTVPVEVLGRDDYGLGAATIVATVTSGSGESVKFREQRLAFASATPRGPAARVWRTALDLQALGLEPGDELYFHVLATDNRKPEPNESRSETVFIKRADTAHVAVAAMTGIALNLAPEYFRSQRQIIIDTEKLLADQPTIAIEAFRNRSADIGIDQHLLRVRYGELVGDETDGGIGEHEGGAPAEHAGPPVPPVEGPHIVNVVPEDMVHRHDTEENATLLATGVKATLKNALAQMWEAEKFLRTYEPRKALPFEYRALELLKEIQQAARVYVKRVGFEPPPLEPDRKRLTGKLEGIADRRVARDRVAQRTLPDVRAAIERLSTNTGTPARDRAVLQRAGEEIARLALERPGTGLELLADLRRYLDAPETCTGCRASLVRGLWALLPPPPPEPSPRDRLSPAAQAYLDRLRAGG